MELTDKKALELHRQMFSDMQKYFGNNPPPDVRLAFKKRWCEVHVPDMSIRNYCFLCQYATEEYARRGEYINMCFTCCPIDWKKAGLTDCCDEKMGGEFYHYAPLDKIINLPEREGVQDVTD